jgi:hypothetical protein
MAGYNDILLYENPKRRRRRRRNPGVAKAVPLQFRHYMTAKGIQEVVAATGGLAASTMIPATFVKDTSTMTRKLGKVLVSLMCALGAGAAADMVLRGTGKAATLGGIAGTGALSLGMFTNVQIGAPRKLLTGTRLTPIGESREVRSQSEGAGIQISTT